MLDRNLVLTGVIHGKTITLDEGTFVPDGYRVKLHLILEPEEGLRLAAGSWAKMPPEMKADLDRYMAELYPEPDDED